MRFSKSKKYSDYIVVFVPPDKNVTRFFLDNKYGHMVVFKFDGEDFYRIEPTYTKLKVDLMEINSEINNKSCKTLSLKIQDMRSRNNILNWVIMHLPHRMDCVSQTMYVLGVHGFILTPKQLYKRLLKKKFMNVVEAEELK